MIPEKSQQEETYLEKQEEGKSIVYSRHLDTWEGDLFVLDEVTWHGDLKGAEEIKKKFKK